MEFLKEYICEWVIDDKYEKAFNLWVKYYYLTELYDQGICSCRSERDGSALPANAWEYGMISRHARELYKEILDETRELEIDEDTWKAAKNAVSRYSPSEIERIYKTLK